ncbi:MAG: response regulator transcription factor [Burkholderiales bacterium]|nr:response regulator transcription factor [Burkholderiales bacterium]
MNPELPTTNRTDTADPPARVAVVVDDHRRMRRVERDLLRKYLPQFSVEQAENAEQAIALVQQYQPELVLMDVHLPGLDGLEATRRILELAPHTTVIVVSLADDWRYFRLAIEAGARAFVPKADLWERLPPLLEHLAEPRHGPPR